MDLKLTIKEEVKRNVHQSANNNTMSRFVIIDLQGFQYKQSDFFCKELTIFKFDYIKVNEVHNFKFKYALPQRYLHKDFSKQIKWLCNN